MPSGVHCADLSAAFKVQDEEELDLLRDITSMHIIPTTTTKKVYEANTHTYIEDYKRKLKTSIHGQYIRIPSIDIDNLIISTLFFPKGHITRPSGAQLLRVDKLSIGVSILNKLDVLHRLKRGGDIIDPFAPVEPVNVLEIDFKLGGGDAIELKFDLREFLEKSVVFKELDINIKRLNNARRIHITARIRYDAAWDRHTENREDRRLTMYRLGLMHGDVTIHLMQSPSADDPSAAADDAEKPITSLPLPPPIRLDENIKMDDISMSIINTIKIGKIALMAGSKFARVWFCMPSEIGIYAPTIVHLNTFVFYCCTGVMHELSDEKWFLKFATVTTDERMLHDAAALCLQRLSVAKGNALDIVRLFNLCQVSNAHGLLDLERWLEDHQEELSKERLDEKDAKDVDMYTACKNVCWWKN